MMERHADVFYYITVMNENYEQPSLPPGVEDDILKGMYRLRPFDAELPGSKRVRLLGSGAILREAIAAADMLAADWGVASEIWSVTSFAELERDSKAVERRNRLHPLSTPHRSHVGEKLAGPVPIVAATDYVRAYPGLIAPYVGARFVTLGTDGFGRSDTRAVLRRFFEVDRQHITVAALQALAQDGALPPETVAAAVERYELEAGDGAPWER
jgi:pyruvate dehydrogenase E1 component